ncbi:MULTISPECIES: fumarylacetoacetate hydrolase family protein [Sorangium]|uniref:Fumarylacetoacetate hydrolase n=1 Tax=Sorangium cellulosum TaxID=56 RepID=A0A150QAN5_SORCE|nr:fumarylacetoacetate hydrolase family protein [Sorangium cellulosum]KYF65054.1 fumarylacetoacetate hydrolase [Sorangium cellulosum]
MKLFRFAGSGGPRLGIEDERGARHDLTAASPEAFASVASWLALPDPLGAVRDARARAAAHPLPPDVPLLAPIDGQEVWAAGVTYERSRNARKEESAGGGDFYDRVYEAERPELFFKATPRLVAGPGAPVRIRRDSSWNVPEPELALVVSTAGRIVGYTAGNDVSSRSIEGDNPLYLPQAKVYDGCCALGPAIALADEPGLDLRALSIQLAIRRRGEAVFAGETSTARMRRAPEELVAYLTRELSFPAGVVLMTGTGIVPPDSFTLEPGDLVEITIPGAGTLANPVSQG